MYHHHSSSTLHVPEQVLHIRPALDLHNVLVPIIKIDPLACGPPWQLDTEHSVNVLQVAFKPL